MQELYNPPMAKNKKQQTSRKAVTKKESKAVEAAPVVAETQQKSTSFWIPLLSVIAIVVFGFIAYRWLIIAQVNGAIISRVEYYRELRRVAGKQVVEDMVNKKLMKQALAEKKIEVTEKEIDAEIASLEKQLKSQNQSLDALLKQQNVTRNELRENIALSKGFEKFFANKVTVSDAEVAKLIEENPTMFPEETSEKDKLAQARQQIKTRKLTQEYQNWQTDSRKNAKIVIVTQ